MSSKKYAAPLHLEITPSRYLLILFFSLHFISFVLLFFIPIDSILLVVLSVLILLSAVHVFMHHVNKMRPTSIVGLIWDIEDDWFLLQRNGGKKLVELDGNSFIHPFFAILNFKQEGRLFSRSVILLKDNINQNDFRRLRVRLKVTNLYGEVVE